MLKNFVSIRSKFSSLKVFARHAHKKHAHNKHVEILEADTRLRAEFLKRKTQGLHRQKPSFRKFYDPKSRNVYRKIEDDEEQYEDDEENDSMWSLNDREMYVWRSSDNGFVVGAKSHGCAVPRPIYCAIFIFHLLSSKTGLILYLLGSMFRILYRLLNSKTVN